MNIIRRLFSFIYRLSFLEKVLYGFLLVILLQVAQFVFNSFVKALKELTIWVTSNSNTIFAITVSILLFGTGYFLYFKSWKKHQHLQDEYLEDEELEDKYLSAENDEIGNKALSIYTEGNYNENIHGDYVEIHGHQININNDFTQVADEIRDLVEYLKGQGYKQEEAEDEIVKELEEKSLKNPRIQKTIYRLRKSFNKNSNPASYQDVVREVVKIATSYSYTNSKDFTDIIGGDFHGLNELLQAKQWKKADWETAKIIYAIGHNELPESNYYKQYPPDYIVEEHIKVIPKKYLKTIDSLWIKHSNRRFGFSVQKQIYEKILKETKYNNSYCYSYNSQIMERFGDLVGWRKGGDWLYYVDLYDSLKTAASGHLPLAYMLSSDELEKCEIDFDIFLKMIDRRTIF